MKEVCPFEQKVKRLSYSPRVSAINYGILATITEFELSILKKRLITLFGLFENEIRPVVLQ